MEKCTVPGPAPNAPILNARGLAGWGLGLRGSSIGLGGMGGGGELGGGLIVLGRISWFCQIRLDLSVFVCKK